ncbi:MAG: Bug family tripartite tricarboxylate transporter substrate binding protein [Burkholderiales bacterium]
MGILLALGVCGVARAQDFPSKPIRIIVPYPAGGATDIAARVYGRKYAEAWGQPVLVENRAGAGGNIGTAAVAKSAPDGYTWLFNNAGGAVSPVLYKSLSYDAIKDLQPVAMMFATAGVVLAVSPALNVNTVQEFIAHAKAQSGKLNYASSGMGSGPHLVGEWFRMSAGIDIVHVPYKGDADIIPALISNQVQASFLPALSGFPLIGSGKVRILALSGGVRWPSVPNLPTLKESGVTDLVYTGWNGFFVASGTPPAIVAKINNEAERMIHAPDVQKFYPGWGAVAAGGLPEEFAKRFRADVDTFGRIIRAANIPLVD